MLNCQDVVVGGEGQVILHSEGAVVSLSQWRSYVKLCHYSVFAPDKTTIKHNGHKMSKFYSIAIINRGICDGKQTYVRY